MFLTNDNGFTVGNIDDLLQSVAQTQYTNKEDNTVVNVIETPHIGE